jgi:hypothetical protein
MAVAPQQPVPTHTPRRTIWPTAVVAGVVGGLVVLLFTGFVAPGFLLSDSGPGFQLSTPTAAQQPPAGTDGGGHYHTNHILKDNPYESVRQVYQRVAGNSPDFACGVFSDEAAQQFAEHFNARDCPDAIRMLNAQVDKAPGSKTAYAEPDFHGRMGEQPSEGSITISSCDLGVTGGPRLGAFTVSRVDKGQWLITGHQRESC